MVAAERKAIVHTTRCEMTTSKFAIPEDVVIDQRPPSLCLRTEILISWLGRQPTRVRQLLNFDNGAPKIASFFSTVNRTQSYSREALMSPFRTDDQTEQVAATNHLDDVVNRVQLISVSIFIDGTRRLNTFDRVIRGLWLGSLTVGISRPVVRCPYLTRHNQSS